MSDSLVVVILILRLGCAEHPCVLIPVIIQFLLPVMNKSLDAALKVSLVMHIAVASFVLTLLLFDFCSANVDECQGIKSLSI